MRFLSCSATLCLSFLLASIAQATTYDISGSYSNVSKSGEFDIGASSPIPPNDFLGGTATFVFQDLSGFTLSSSSNVTTYSSESYDAYTTTNTYTNPLDAAQVTLGSVTGSGSNSSGYEHLTNSSTAYSYFQYISYYQQESSCSFSLFGICWSYNYWSVPIYATGTTAHTTTNVYNGYVGDFSVVVPLTAANTSSINNGELPFSFVTTSGQDQLIGATLDYQATIPVIAAVPEPELAPLLLLGLALAAWRRRRT